MRFRRRLHFDFVYMKKVFASLIHKKAFAKCIQQKCHAIMQLQRSSGIGNKKLKSKLTAQALISFN